VTPFVHVARQPIFDCENRVFGYELLYRNGALAGTAADQGDAASARVLTDAVLLIGLDTLTNGRRAFINATRNFLLDGLATLLPPANVVIEILETTRVDHEVVEACRSLRRAGFTLALDDYTPGTDADVLLPLVQYAKIDVLQTPSDRWSALRSTIPAGVKLLAEKVEDASIVAQAKASGFELFQGYYFCRPTTFSSAAIPAASLASARLLARLYRPDIKLAEIAELIKSDVSLTYYVLRSVNSAASPTRREIRSLDQALVLLGLEKIRRWASAWVLARTAKRTSAELVSTALVRGRCCEVLAERYVNVESAEWFLLGLCSLLDAMLGCPLEEVTRQLPLSPDVQAALIGNPNQLRSGLDAVVAFERGEWEQAGRLAAQLGVEQQALSTSFCDALGWASRLTSPY
jgi:EAL and modified HD-GYP domain-containing signal transduction protein